LAYLEGCKDGERKLIRIGLTGNIACGKSSVAAILAGWGAVVIDADIVAHDVMRTSNEVFDHLVERFGSVIIGSGGQIDRKALASLVFTDANALRDLDSIMHPTVLREIESRISGFTPTPAVVVIEAVKLIESGLHHKCDFVWLVTCQPKVAYHRLMSTRNYTSNEADARITAQGSDAVKRQMADEVIENNDDIEELRQRVLAAWNKLKISRAGKRDNGRVN
jgi:dephospho-CoA kinase